MPVRGVIFDLFHTLTTAEPAESDLPLTSDVLGIGCEEWERALTVDTRWRSVGEERDPFAIVKRVAHRVDPSIPDATLRKATEVRLRRFAATLRRIPPENVAAVRGLRAAGVRLGLLSNADAMEIVEWRGSPLAGLFDAELFSCNIGHAKPEAASFLACTRALELEPHECAFVGDGGSDELNGARAVGLTTVFYSGVTEILHPNHVESRRAIAHHHIRSMTDLARVLGIAATVSVE